MAYNRTQSDLAKQAQKELERYNAQLANFDQTYDHTKDAGWVAADKQLRSAAQIAGSNAAGKLSNRIGATSTAQVNAAESIYANALKNSQNLIPTYKDAAYNKLLNQRNTAEQTYWNAENFDLQEYAQQLAQQNTDRAYEYQVGRDKVSDAQWNKNYDFQQTQFRHQQNQDSAANKIALANAEAAQTEALAAAAQQEWERQYKYDLMNAEWSTNYKNPGVSTDTSGENNAGASGAGSTGTSGSTTSSTSSGKKTDPITSVVAGTIAGTLNGVKQAQNTTGSSGFSGNKNTANFMSSMLSEEAFNNSTEWVKSTFGTYKNYIAAALVNQKNQGKLSTQEYQYLQYLYGLN